MAKATEVRDSKMNYIDRLKAQGVEVVKGVLPKFPLKELVIPTKGPLAHPRRDKPVKQSLVDDIVAKYRQSKKSPGSCLPGIQKPGLAWAQPQRDGTFKVIVGDCCRRVMAGRKAEAILHESGELGEGDSLTMFIELYQGDEKGFLLERRRRDGDPEKEPHTATEMAREFAAIFEVGGTYEEIVATIHPLRVREFDKAVVSAMAEQWASVEAVKGLAAAFDHGIEIDGVLKPVSIALLPALLDKVPDAEKLATLTEWVADGITSRKGATRRANRAAALVASAEGDPSQGVPSIEEDGPFAHESSSTTPSRSDESAVQGEPEGETPSPRPKSTSAPRVRATAERVRANTVSKVYELAMSKTRMSAAERAFVVAAKLSCGDKDEAVALAKEAVTLPADALHAIAGAFWRLGNPKAWKIIEPHVSPTVIATITQVFDGNAVGDAPAMTKKSGKGK